MKLQEIHLADRERARAGQLNAQQRPRGRDVDVVGRLLEVLERAQCQVWGLHLVEDDQVPPGSEIEPLVDRKLRHDSMRIEVAAEEAFQGRVRLEVAVGDAVILPFTELSKEERLAGLPRTAQEQWLPPRGGFPGHKIRIKSSLHTGCLP